MSKQYETLSPKFLPTSAERPEDRAAFADLSLNRDAMREDYGTQNFDERLSWQEGVFLDQQHVSFSLLSGSEVDDVLNLLINNARDCAIMRKSHYAETYPALKGYMEARGMRAVEEEDVYLFSRNEAAEQAYLEATSLEGEASWRAYGALSTI